MESARQPDPPLDIRTRFPALYGDLRTIAAQMLASRPPRGPSPTELTHEAFLKLLAEEARRRTTERSELGSKPDAFFKACFGAACRDVLVDQQRRRKAEKRGGERKQEPMPTSVVFEGCMETDVLEIDDAITVLSGLDSFLAQLLEMRAFGGLTIEECAELLATSKRTIERKWALARAWLEERLA